MKKTQAHRLLALTASKKGYRVQIHKTAKENNLRLVAPDGNVFATTLKINSSTHYDTKSVMRALGDIRKLNCAAIGEIANCTAFKRLFKEVSLEDYLRFTGGDIEYEDYEMHTENFDAWFTSKDAKLRKLGCVAKQYKDGDIEVHTDGPLILNGYDNWVFDSVEEFEDWANSREWETNASRRSFNSAVDSGRTQKLVD